MGRGRGALAGLAVLVLTIPAAAGPFGRHPDVAPRIVNGVFTFAHATTGALLTPDDPDAAQVACSGTLIGCRTFLTAGHCVEGALAPSNWVVFFQHAGFVPVAAVDLHPDYLFPPADVAVITLAVPVTGLRPTPLDVTGGHAPGTSGTIAGFGRSGGGSADYGLKRAGAVSLATCGGGISDTTSICWGFQNPIGAPGDDSNTCNGDSGGPLFVDAGSAFVVAGVTSGGSSNDCLAPDASFDARVSFYAPWIQGVGGEDLDNTSCGPPPYVGDADVTVAGFVGAVSGAAPEGRHAVVVPAGADALRVTMNAVDDGSDFDLYVKFGAPPTTSDFDCRQNGTGQFGHCEFPSPPAGTWHVLVTRYAGSGAYQVTATTLGASAFCTDPGHDGLPCDDGNACTDGETCQAGACGGGAAASCDDGLACTIDTCLPATGCVQTPDHGACGPCNACDAALGCVGGPRGDCARPRVPLAAKLKLKRAGTPGGDLLLWKFARGEETLLGDFGDPLAADGFSLCLYDESGATPALVLRADAPAGGTCGTAPCWKATGSSGFRYKDREGTPNGLLKLQVKAGGPGRAKASIKGKGGNLPALPALPLALPSRVQLHAAGSACWEAVYDGGGASRNDATSFLGRSD